ncbi:MAG: sodium:solute symporter family protein [Candidatus Omnitrophica bacterium]|nr:sodium:solute symporter family protein [Candidatus Omnitrophota bacterium]
MTQTQFLILAGVSFYVFISLAVGFWTRKWIKTERDYIVAGGRLGWILSIGTIFATWFGAETCMGSSGTAFNKGILGVIADPFGAGVCLVISGLFFAKHFRKKNYETIVDFFKERYGITAACFLSVMYLPAYLGWIGAQLIAFGYILNSLTGFPIMLSIIFSTAVVLIYAYMGGMWADTITDFFQMLILVAGLLIIFPVLVKSLGGFSSVISRTPPEFFYFYPRNTSTLDWLWYLQAWMMVGIGSLPAQDLFARTMAAKNFTVSRWSSILAGIFYVMIGLLPVLIGIFGRLAMPSSSGETILVDMALKYLSPVLIMVMVGALLAAIMSSADSALLAPSSIIGHNILPLIKKDTTEQDKLNWCKWSVPLIGIFSLMLALYFKNIYKLCQESWGILLVGVAAPMILGVYFKRATAKGALASSLGGIIIWLFFKIKIPGYPSNLIGFFASMIILVVVSLCDRKVKTY